MLIRMKQIIWIVFLGAVISCASEKPEAVTSEINRSALADTIERSLTSETLARWYPLCFDKEYTGYLSNFTYDWKPVGSQNKMIVTQARHMWVNAKAHELYPEEAVYTEGAAYGLKFLKDVMWDKDHGGFYTLTSRDGHVVDETKNAYGNAFGIFSLAAYYHAFHDTVALDLARKAFWWLEKHSHDSVHNGYFQHMTSSGEVIVRNSSVPSHAETGYKDQNSSIHLLEALTELYQVWPDSLVRERLQEMLFLIRDTITSEKGYLILFFSPEWRPVSYRDSAASLRDSHHNLDHVSFGHDVETAYLMLEASHVLGLAQDTTTERICKKMLDHALTNGFDHENGGFYDEGYYFKEDGPCTVIRDTKNWWAQAEGLNTLLLFADKYPDDTLHYASKFQLQWNYISKYLIDHEFGDWYAGGLDKEPFQKHEPKGHQWKATYHHFRSLSNCIHELRKTSASASR
jgi:mannobiose 2-epimerase